MLVQDWTRVDAAIVHAFHHGWIEELSRVLNGGILTEDYYALPGGQQALLVAEPQFTPTAETDM